MRILVVDDEPAVRTSLERALSLEGYDVDLAGDGAAALDRWPPRRPTRWCSTSACRRVDGLEVCRRLRAAGDRTPVLMLTARDAVDDRVDGPRRRRRRLPGQALRAARAAGAAARPAAPRRPRRGRAALRRPRAGPRRARGPPRRAAHRPLAHRVHPARAVHAPSSSGADPHRRSSSRCGATTSARPPTRSASTWATCGARPRQAGEPRAAAHRPRRRLRPARGLTVALRAEAHADAAVIVGVTLVLARSSPTRRCASELRGQVDDALRGSAALLPAAARPRARRRRAPLGRRASAAAAERSAGPAATPSSCGRQRQRDRARRRPVGPALPVTGATLATADGAVRRARFSDHDVDGLHLRVLTAPARGRSARCRSARSLADADRVLAAPAPRARRARGRRHRAGGRR